MYKSCCLNKPWHFFSHVKCENLKLLQILFYLTWSAAKPVKDSNQSNPIDWFAQTVTENFFFLKSSMLSHVRPSSVFCLHSFFDEIVRIPSTSNTWNVSHSAGLLCLVNTICPWVFCFEKKSKNAKTKFVTLKLRMRCCCFKGLSWIYQKCITYIEFIIFNQIYTELWKYYCNKYIDH